MESQSIEKKQPPIIKDDEIDLVALGMHVWNGRGIILKTVGAFVVLGLLIALTSPKQYTSRVKLIPETSHRSGLGGLGGLASQFGFGNISAAATEAGSIPTEYYPEIAHSLPFLLSLLEYETYIAELDDKMSLYLLFTEEQNFSLIGVIKRYTIGLPRTLLNSLRSSKADPVVVEDDAGHVMRLTQKQWEAIEKLKNRFTLEIDREGIISIIVQMPDPVLAAEVANRASNLLSEYILEYKTDKAREDLQFVEARYQEASARFEAAQEKLARFRDGSHGRMTAMAQTEEQRLQSEYDLAFNVYNTLARQLEESRLKLQEDTPVVKVLEPAVVPKDRSAPRRSMIMIVSVFLGGFIGIGILFGRMIWNNLKVKVEEYER